MAIETEIVIRPIEEKDIAAVTQLGDDCYSSAFSEGFEAMGHKILLGQGMSLMAEANGEICGYFISYPAYDSHISVLNACQDVAPGCCWYMHDMCIGKQWRGKHLVTRLFNAGLAIARARGLRTSAAVSVQGSLPYLQHFGYKVSVPLDKEAQTVFESYGEGAVYVRRENILE